MPNITGIGLKNFRVFKEMTEFHFAPLTILTGANSSGKSSLFKALILLKENAAQLSQEIKFNSEVHQLGKGEYIVNEKEELLTFRFHSASSQIKTHCPLDFEYNLQEIKVNKVIDVSYKVENDGISLHSLKLMVNQDWALKLKKNRNGKFIKIINWHYLYRLFHQSFEYVLREEDTLASFIKKFEYQTQIQHLKWKDRYKELSNQQDALQDEYMKITGSPEPDSFKDRREQITNLINECHDNIDAEVEKLKIPQAIGQIEDEHDNYVKRVEELNSQYKVLSDKIEALSKEYRFNPNTPRNVRQYNEISTRIHHLHNQINEDSTKYRKEHLDAIEKQLKLQRSNYETEYEEYTSFLNKQYKEYPIKHDQLQKELFDLDSGPLADARIHLAAFKYCLRHIYPAKHSLNIGELHGNDEVERIGKDLMANYLKDEELNEWVKKRKGIEAFHKEILENKRLEIGLDSFSEDIEAYNKEIIQRKTNILNQKEKVSQEIQSLKGDDKIEIFDLTKDVRLAISKYLEDNAFFHEELLWADSGDKGIIHFKQWIYNLLTHFTIKVAKQKSIVTEQRHIDVQYNDFQDSSSVFQKRLDRNYKETNEDKRWRLFDEFIRELTGDTFKDIKAFLSSNIKYISAVRGTQKRLYKQTIPNTENSHWISQYVDKYSKFNDQYISFINKWLEEFGIGESIEVETPEGIMSALYIKNGNERRNIADLGFGYTQLLGILINILLIKFENSNGDNPSKAFSLLLIEEPEANLHPNLQAKLADFLIDAYKQLKIQFIIETHSEYFVRKLQYFVSTNEFNTEDINIYYIYPPQNIPEGKTQVENIRIRNNGKLNNEFGKGFFDENARWVTRMEDYQKLLEAEEIKKELEQLKTEQESHIECLVLTEDSEGFQGKSPHKSHIWKLLEANQFDMSRTKIMTYKTSRKINTALGIAEETESKSNIKRIIIHQDSDGHPELRKEYIERYIKEHGLKKTIPFITEQYSIEGYFINADHIHYLYPEISKEIIQSIITKGFTTKKVIEASIKSLEKEVYKDKSIAKFLIKTKPLRFIKSKVLKEYINKSLNNLRKKGGSDICQTSPFITTLALSNIAKEIWPNE